MQDRYLRIILTVIALELAWLGVRDLGTPVTAQAPQTPTAVIIQGIEIPPSGAAMPVYSASPLDVRAPAPLPITTTGPLKIAADSPIPVQSVPYTPAVKPGE